MAESAEERDARILAARKAGEPPRTEEPPRPGPTPGPWKFDGDLVRGENDKVVIGSWEGEIDIATVEDVRLIEQAPRMAACIRTMLAFGRTLPPHVIQEAQDILKSLDVKAVSNETESAGA